MSNEKTVKVLAIDGGGIRGVIPAVLLQEIEKRTNKPIAELFDMVAGTSTGGILALGLLKPAQDGKTPHFKAEDLLRFYEEEGKNIFYSTPWRRLGVLSYMFQNRYSTDRIEKLLQQAIGDYKLSDALQELLIPTYDIERRRPYFFKRWKARQNKAQDFAAWQIARAASAAPTFFPPARIEANEHDTDYPNSYYALIDGSVYVDNPALCAYIEARIRFPEATKIIVVSLGTGEINEPIPYDEAKDWGIAEWLRPILGIIMDGTTDIADYQLKELLNTSDGTNQRYYRYQIELTQEILPLDNVNDDNIKALKEIGYNIISERETEFAQMCEQLLSD